jgi:hypothetical protein
MRVGRMLIWLLAAGVLLLQSCNLPAPTHLCEPSELVAPKLVDPHDWAHLPGDKPLLSWVFKGVSYPSPEGDAVACQPELYRVSISTAPLFLDELGKTVPGTAFAGGLTAKALQLGHTYHWNVTAVSMGHSGPTSQTRSFSLGDPCTFDELQAPTQIWPPDGWTVITVNPPFRFTTTMTCLPDNWVLRIAKDPALTVKGGTSAGPSEGWENWTGSNLENCSFYYWRVAAHVGQLNLELGPFEGQPGVGPSSPTWSFSVHVPGTSCWMPPGGTDTPTATSSMLEPIHQNWQVTANANCREGPGTSYDEDGFTPNGYAAKVEGRNEDGTWFRLIDPNGVSCWVSKVALAVPSDWESLKILSYPPPPPTEAPPEENPVPAFDCSQLTDPQSCIAHPGCVWQRMPSGCVSQ